VSLSPHLEFSILFLPGFPPQNDEAPISGS